jgi:hypothetical protein
MKKALCPRCGGALGQGIKFWAKHLEAKGQLQQVFAAARKRGITLTAVTLCQTCTAKLQGRSVQAKRKPAAQSAQAVPAKPKADVLFRCGGCSKERSDRGSIVLPKIGKRCAECAPSARLWAIKIGVLKEAPTPKPEAVVSAQANVATASKR